MIISFLYQLIFLGLFGRSEMPRFAFCDMVILVLSKPIFVNGTCLGFCDENCVNLMWIRLLANLMLMFELDVVDENCVYLI